MPTYKKIPGEVKEIGAVASGRYCVFARGILEAGKVFEKIYKAERKGSIPMVGYVTIDRKQYYYCLYGLVDDPEIYE